MEKDIILLNSKVVNLSSKSKSKNTREAIMYVHTIDEENANGLTFTLAATENYKDTLINKPVVVKMDCSETDFKGHEPVYDANGNIVKLDTIPIGTITESWIEDRDIDGETKKALMCKATIWSYKFPTAIEIMQELYEDGNLDTSVEVAIYSYADDSEPQHRKTVEIEYLANCMLGSLILPADSNAGVVEMFYKEVAQALQQDKPGDEPDLNISNSQDGGVVMISMEEIKDQLRALLNPNDNSEGGWKMDYYTWDMFTYEDHCVVRSAEDGMYYRLNFEVQNEATVVLSGDKKLQLHQFVDAPEGENVEVNGLFLKYKEMESKVSELSTSLTDKETEIAQLKEDTEKLQTEISQLKEVKTDEEIKDEAIVKLNSQINELNDKIAQMQPLVEKHLEEQEIKQQQELAEKQDALKQLALSSKLFDEKEFEENEQLKTAINELNEQLIKSEIADRVIAKTATSEPKKDENGDVVINTTEPKDLIPSSSVCSKYGINN